ncbi:hypothetical protein UF37_05700, partial [Vibrio parahaemolyticus]
HACSEHELYIDLIGQLTNNIYINLTGKKYTWEPDGENIYDIRSRRSTDVIWKETCVDLVFVSNSMLKAYAELYAQDLVHTVRHRL